MQQKKSIAIIINSLNFGGAERVVSLLINELHLEFDIHLILLNDIIKYSLPSNIKIFHLNEQLGEGNISSFLKLPLQAKTVSRYYKKNKIDVSISFLNRPCYINALMKKYFGFRGKTIACERSYQSSILNFTGGGSSIYQIITKRLIQFSYNAVDVVLANSKLSAIDLEQNFAVKKSVSVIYNPINIAEVLNQASEQANIPEAQFYFSTAGSFRIEKNFPLLLRAFSTLKQLPVHLIVVGGGTKESELVALAADLNISDKVTFTGFQNNPFKYINASNCFVLSSYTEGFPNVLLEALACSKAVISTDCKSGPREILAPSSDLDAADITDIEMAEFGILVPNDDAIALASAMEKMYTDQRMRENYEMRSFSRAQAFDVKAIIPQFQAVFSSE